MPAVQRAIAGQVGGTQRGIGVVDVASSVGVGDYRAREAIIGTARLVGSNSEGATADFISVGSAAAWIFTANATGSISRLWVQTKVANPLLTSAEVGIYSDSAGNPGTLLGKATVDSIVAAQGAAAFSATLATPVGVVSGTAYHLAVSAIGENFDWQGTVATAATGYNELSGQGGVLPATWAGGSRFANRIAIWGETTGSSLADQYGIFVGDRVKTGTYEANTGRHFVTAAAHAANVGYWYLINPVGSPLLTALRTALWTMGIASSALVTPTSPRMTLERFSFTGTPSGAVIDSAQVDAASPAPTARLLSASTGLTITMAGLAYSFLVMPSFTTTANPPGAGAMQYAPAFGSEAPEPTDFPSWGDPGTIVLQAGEGVLLRQADAGTATEATSRVATTDLTWEEFLT